jgi:hypothetical protein
MTTVAELSSRLEGLCASLAVPYEPFSKGTPCICVCRAGCFAHVPTPDDIAVDMVEIFHRQACSSFGKLCVTLQDPCFEASVESLTTHVVNVIIVCAAYLNERPWTSPTLRVLAARALHLLRHVNGSASVVLTEQDLVARYIRDILQKLKPYFSEPTKSSVTLKNTPYGSLRPSKNSECSDSSYETLPLWKQFPDLPYVLVWCVTQIQRPYLTSRWAPQTDSAVVTTSDPQPDLLYLIIPPVLRLLDDYDTRVSKRVALEILVHLIAHVPVSIMRQFGLAEVFWEPVSACTTYRDDWKLVERAFQCLLGQNRDSWQSDTVHLDLGLVDVIASARSEKWFDILDKVLHEFVLREASVEDRLQLRQVTTWFWSATQILLYLNARIFCRCS